MPVSPLNPAAYHLRPPDPEGPARSLSRGFASGLSLGQARQQSEAYAAAQAKEQQAASLRSGYLGGDQQAGRDLLATDPEGGANFMEAIGKMDDRQREKAEKGMEQFASMGLSVLNADPLSQSALYSQLLEHAESEGADVSDAPQWGPDALPWLDMEVAKATSISDQLKRFEGGPLQEIYDKDSPTGTRLVSRKDALGKPGKPPSGMEIEFDTKTGKYKVSTGRKLGKRAEGEVQTKILSAGDTLSQLTAIRHKFKPEYQQIGTRWEAFKTRWKSKAGQDVSPEDREMLRDFTDYRAEAGQLFALTLKDLSGVAVNPTEFKRAEKWLPNPGTGLFDGDSPDELIAKVDRFDEFTRKALLKYSYIEKNGLGVDDIDIDDMPQLMQERGDKLAAEMALEGLSGEELREAVKKRLVEEFGLGVL